VTPAGRLAVAVLVGVLFAVGSIARGNVLPGLVGGVLASVLVVLVLREVAERERRRRRR